MNMISVFVSYEGKKLLMKSKI